MIYLGSIAAGIQSGVYGGLTTGLFSACQSMAATSVIGMGSVASGIGSLVAGASILGSSRKSKTDDDSNSEWEDSDLDSSAGNEIHLDTGRCSFITIFTP